jgi:predicted phage terminase large subunit-like protein
VDILETTSREAIFGPDIPTDSVQDEVHVKTRENGANSLYFFATAICGFDKVERNPHLELCSYIQRVPGKNKIIGARKVLLIPRDTYKSTIASKALPLWILIQKQFCGLPGREHRILCGSFSSDNAKKQIKAIRHLIERNTFLQWVYPELIPDFTRTTWTDSNLLFPRDGVYGEDTIEAAGVDTHLVSRHYTVQVKDDLEDEKAMQSPTVRRKVYDWYKAAEALFVNEQEAYDLLVGTRWGVDDLYSQIKQNEGDTYEFLCRPLHWTREDLATDAKQAQESGQPSVYDMEPERYAPDPVKTYFFFPKLFPEDSCRRIKAKQGSFMYSMLYLNNPKDPDLAEFKDKDLRYFNFDSHGNVVINHEDGAVETVVFDTLKTVLFWDPAMSGPEQKRNDRNAMVACGLDSEDRMFVLDAHIERQNPTFLYARFIGIHRRYRIQKAAIEDVAFQRVLKFPLYKTQQELGYRFPVIEQRPVGDKDTRIRSLIPRVEMHQLFIRRGLKEMIEEIKGFPLFPTKDGVDALAACQELFGLRVPLSDSQARRINRNARQKMASRSTTTGY